MEMGFAMSNRPGRPESAGNLDPHRGNPEGGNPEGGNPGGAEIAGRGVSDRETFLDEFRDAISPRTLILAAGVLVLQLGFILSYVGAFHSPTPHRIPVAVVAPGPVAARTVAAINGIAKQPVHASAIADEATARAKLARAETSAVFIVNASGTQDSLLVASAGGTSVSGALTSVLQSVEAQQTRTVTVQDVIAAQAGDARGLTGFYLVVGWLVGGYLFASLLGMSKGARPATFRRSLWRLGATIPYAAVSGLGGALLVGPLLGALNGHFAALWGIGTLLVLASATVTIAFQIMLGVLGIGLTVLVFVILGNPSAGGAYQAALLPPFWRAISSALPNGAGTTAIRRVMYFGGHGIRQSILVIAIWALAGAAVSIVASALEHRHRPQSQPHIGITGLS